MAETQQQLPGGVNPLDFLHKLAMQRGLSRPVFLQLSEQGPPHSKVFVWQCAFNAIVAQGTGRSKKEAKVAAARSVRDQINFDDLPPPPTFQSMMERKRKKFENGNGHHANGSEMKKRKYDYARHFQGYMGGGPGIPYGYGGGMGGGPAFDMNYADFGPNPIDPFGYDPFAQSDAKEGNESTESGFEADAAGAMAGSPNRGFMSRLSKLDRYVIKKHTEIYPTEKNLKTILKLVSDVEETTKQIVQEWNKDETNTNKVEGMVRVGELAKGLLLATDRSVSAVILCNRAPNKDMLGKLHLDTRSKIKEVDSDYDTLLLEKEAAFAVSKPLVDDNGEKLESIICYVTLTATSMRKKPENVMNVSPDGGDESADPNSDTITEGGKPAATTETEVETTPRPPTPPVEDEANLLPKEKCLAALAELRHARWFAAMAASLPSCVECIRIMKDLVRRDPVWSSLSDYTIELLVERSLYSAWRPLNPAASLMRVMEVVASGLFMADGSGLKDPCEHENLDVCMTMTLQDREDITRGAQYYLRQMHFRKIWKVLGMPVEDPDETKLEDDANGKTVVEENQQPSDQ